MTQQDPTAAFAQFNIQLTTAEAATAFVEAMGPYMSLFMGQQTPAQANQAARRAPRAIGETEEEYTDKALRAFAVQMEKETGIPVVDEEGNPVPSKGRLPKAWRDYLTEWKRSYLQKQSGVEPDEEPLEAAVVDEEPAAEPEEVRTTKPRKGLGVRRRQQQPA